MPLHVASQQAHLLGELHQRSEGRIGSLAQVAEPVRQSRGVGARPVQLPPEQCAAPREGKDLGVAGVAGHDALRAVGTGGRRTRAGVSRGLGFVQPCARA